MKRIAGLFGGFVTMVCVLPSAMAAADGMYGSAEVLYLHRDTEDVSMTVNAVPVETLNSNDAALDWGWGGRLTLGQNRGDNSIEGSLMYVSHSESGSTGVDQAEPFEPAFDPLGADAFVNSGGFTGAARHDVDYDADMGSLEVNFIQPLQDGFHWLVGVRGVMLDEDLELFSFDEFPIIDSGKLNVATENRMLGVQVGVKGGKNIADKVAISGLGKVGAFVNWQDKDLDYYETEGGDSFKDSDSGTEFSWLVEAGINLDFAVSKNATLSIGYMALYLGGVALAPDNFPEANSAAEFTKFDGDGDTFYHGGRIGLAVNF